MRILKIQSNSVKPFLIYDANCIFCVNVAHFLRDFVEIKDLTILPNTSKRCLRLHPGIKKSKIEKDVHLVVIAKKREVYSGADAVAKIISLKEKCGFVWTIHSMFPLPFKIFYFLSKKIRKYAF